MGDDKSKALKFVKPTAEEMAAARAILSSADPKQKRSIQNSMAAFLKSNIAVDGNQVALDSRGDVRCEYIEKYLVYQHRKKASVAKTTSESSNVRQTHSDYVHWSFEQMEKEIGAKKAKHWVESNLLKWRPDRVTGNTEIEFREYMIPIDWTRNTDEDAEKLSIQGEAQASDADFENLKSMRAAASAGTPAAAVAGAPATSVAGAPAAASVVVKQEPLDAMTLKQQKEKESADKVQAFLRNPDVICRNLQDMTLEAQKLYARANKAEFGQDFAAKLLKHQTKLKAVVGAVEKVVLGYAPALAEVPKLLKTVDVLTELHEKVQEYAIKNEISIQPEKRRKTKK